MLQESIVFSSQVFEADKPQKSGRLYPRRTKTLNTPLGAMLKSLLINKVKVKLSARGVGSGEFNNDGILVIGESYKLITFDAVEED